MKRRVAVAFSGGRDSTALLHAALAAAAGLGIDVVALHVNHGLSPNADAWQRRAAAQCARWRRRGLPVAFAVHRVDERPAPGESVEAWARTARYRALRDMALAHGASIVLLAHHRRDQAETVLLQALRSAGVAGLAGMPRHAERDGVVWARPWLDEPRERIEAYVRRHRLSHVDDESNDDPRFARSRLRRAVWPALAEAFPQAEATLAEAAAWAAQASACLDELAAADLAQVAGEAGLDLAAWRGLSAPRRANALRAWLRAQSGRPAPATLVTRLMDELAGARAATWPVPGGVLRAYRGLLRHERAAAQREAAPAGAREATLAIRAAGRRPLPGWGGTLEIRRVKAGGVPLAWLAHAELRPRTGGERFQAAIGRPPRSLKKQFQAAALAAWQRAGPLVYSGGQLVFVPGLGVDARVIGLPGQALVTLRWVPDGPPHREAGEAPRAPRGRASGPR